MSRKLFLLLFGASISLWATEESSTEQESDTSETELISLMEYPNQISEKPFFPSNPEKIQPSLSVEEPKAIKQFYYYAGGLFPTLGYGFRYYKDFGIEIDGSYFLLGAKCSTSIFQYIGENKFCYIGAGVGAYLSMLSPEVLNFQMPVYIGIEGKKYFGDIGCDVLFTKSTTAPIPTLRAGVRF